MLKRTSGREDAGSGEGGGTGISVAMHDGFANGPGLTSDLSEEELERGWLQHGETFLIHWERGYEPWALLVFGRPWREQAARFPDATLYELDILQQGWEWFAHTHGLERLREVVWRCGVRLKGSAVMPGATPPASFPFPPHPRQTDRLPPLTSFPDDGSYWVDHQPWPENWPPDQDLRDRFQHPTDPPGLRGQHQTRSIHEDRQEQRHQRISRAGGTVPVSARVATVGTC